jgi:hypothetical protein
VPAFRRTVGVQFQLQDILALVVGYGMAALLFRAFWPSTRPLPALGVPVLGLYLWLGLAMSGPIILLQRRPSPPAAVGESSGSPDPAGSRTWAELAWLLIGIYWIVLGSMVIPARLRGFQVRDTLIFGLVPVAVALGLRLFGPKAGSRQDATSVWTHRAAIALLCTWPIAWVFLIIVGQTLQ